VVLSDQAENIRRAFYHFLAELKGDFLLQGEFYSQCMGNKKNACRLTMRNQVVDLVKNMGKIPFNLLMPFMQWGRISSPDRMAILPEALFFFSR
jgi:hypothetical protein